MSNIVPSNQLFPVVPDTELVKYSGFGYSYNRFFDMYFVMELLSQEGYLILPSDIFRLDFSRSIIEMPEDNMAGKLYRYKANNIPNDFNINKTFGIQYADQVEESLKLIQKEISFNGRDRRAIFCVRNKDKETIELFGLDNIGFWDLQFSVAADFSSVELNLTGYYLNVIKAVQGSEAKRQDQLPEYKQI